MLEIIIFFTLNFSVYESDNFILFIKDKEDTIYAREVLSYFEHYKKIIDKFTGNKEKGKVKILFENIGISNGFSNPPFKLISILKTPPFYYFTEISNIRNNLEEIVVHEYAHNSHLRKRSKFYRILTAFLGDGYILAYPNLLSPLWLIEGVAVYSESYKISNLVGRLNTGYYKECSSLCPKNFKNVTYVLYDFPYYSKPYIYGGNFIEHLSKKYGEKNLKKFFEIRGKDLLAGFDIILPSLSIDRNAKKVFGKSFPELWNEFWAETEAIKGLKNDKDIKQITKNGGKKYFLNAYNGKLYWIEVEYKKLAVGKRRIINKIVEYNPQNDKKRIIAKHLNPIVLPLKFKNNKIFYGILEKRKGFKNFSFNSLGFTVKIIKVDLKNLKKEALFEEKIKAFYPLAENKILWVKWEKDSSEIFIWENNKNTGGYKIEGYIGDVLISPILKWKVVIYRKKGKSWGIYRIKIKNKVYFEKIIDTEWDEVVPYFWYNFLFFESTKNKQCRIYVLDLAREKFFLVNDYFSKNPVILGNKIYFISLNEKGFDIYQENLDFEKLGEIKYIDNQKEKRYAENVKKVKIKKTTPFKNFAYLLNPFLRLPVFNPLGLILLGADGVFQNMYSIVATEKWGYAQFSSNILAPFEIYSDLEWENRNIEKYSVKIAYPIYTSYTNQIKLSMNYSKNKKIGIGLYLNKDFEKNQISTDITLWQSKEGKFSIYIFKNTKIGGFEWKTDFDFTNKISDVNLKSELLWEFLRNDVKYGWWNPSVFIEETGTNLWLYYENLKGYYIIGLAESFLLKNWAIANFGGIKINLGIGIDKDGKMVIKVGMPFLSFFNNIEKFVKISL